MRAQRLDEVREQRRDVRVVRARRRDQVVGQVLEDVGAAVLGEHGDEAHVVAVVELALLEHPAGLALDPRPQVVGAALGEEQVAPLAQAGQAVLEHGLHEAVLGAEVVLHRRVVAVAGGRADLAQRHALDRRARRRGASAARTICSLVDGAITPQAVIPPRWTVKVNRLKVQTFRELLDLGERARMTANSTSHADATPTRVDFDLTGMTTRRASDEALEQVKATGCPVVWTEDNGGHWIVGTYELVASGVPRLGDVLVGAARARAVRDRVHQQQPPALPPGGERPAALARLPARAGRDPLAAGVGAAAGTGPALDASTHSTRSSRRARSSSSTTSPPWCPARVTLEWLGYPEEEWQWFADTFHGISAYPAGSPEHHEASKAYKPVLARIEEELHDRIASPRDDALTAIAHHEVDGERLPEDIAQSITFLTTVGGIDTTTSLAGGALLAPLGVPGRPATTDRRARRCCPWQPRSSCASIRRRVPTSASSRPTPSSVACR